MACAVAVSIAMGGCGTTLVFGERDGVNLAIRANASSTPPIEVNFGLDRVVTTIVPPAGESGGHPVGEAVNMFAGFQVERYGDLDLNKPVGIDIQITTQFASGAAAVSVSGNPAVVNQIVRLNGPTVTRDAAFVPTLTDRRSLLAVVKPLTDDQTVIAATAMAPKLPERSAFLQQSLGQYIPPNGAFTAAGARPFLMKWATLETVTPATLAEWNDALTRARQAGQ
jgi:hypothetical protein